MSDDTKTTDTMPEDQAADTPPVDDETSEGRMTLEARLAWAPWSLLQRGIALAAFTCLLPLFAVLWIAVRIESPGPFLFRQKRRGFKGVKFEILKIRTMSMGSEKRTALGVQLGDASVTRVGKIMRDLKLDELPQLWNIVRGDMELVGPRPIPVALEDELREHIDDFFDRGCVKPGLTNVSQVSILENQLGDKLIHDWKLRFEGELHYIRNKSVAYDVILVLLTGLYVMRKTLRRAMRRGAPETAAPAPNGRTMPVTMVTGIPVCNLDYEDTINRFGEWIDERSHRYVCVAPVHSMVMGHTSADHRLALMNADMNTADGMPVVWARKLFGDKQATRVYGPTLMLQTIERGSREGWRFAFYGGHEDRIEILLSNLREMYPDINIVEAISPPFRQLTDDEVREYRGRLIDAKPDVIWVGIGCPKQERWMRENSPDIPGVMVGVGAAFDFHAGCLRQAPPIMQKFGLEWFFRLCCEPRRLFKRYATTNPIYVALVAKQFFFSLFSRQRYVMELPERPGFPSAAEASASNDESRERRAA